MAAVPPGTRSGTVPWQKRLADLCTAARAPLAVALVWLGAGRGREEVQWAFLLLLAAATLDTLDGYFARISAWPQQTWIGKHDLAFDISFSAGLLLYLTLAGFVSPYLAAVWVGSWILLVWSRGTLSNTGAVLFQAPIYVATLVAALLQATDVVLGSLIWAAVMLLFAGRRFFQVRVPSFFSDLARRRLGGRRWPDQPPQQSRRQAKE